MRVFIDTSVFIAYLLNPHQDSFVQLIFDKIIEQRLTLLVSEELLQEIDLTVRRKPYLLGKISQTQLEQFITALRDLAEMIPPLAATAPPITRDVTDDYLIAYAVIGEADYLISVDKDLLVLERIGTVQILHTAEFRKLL